MKRQATNWEKTFAEYISDKELILQLHEELSKLGIKKTQF